VFFVLSVLPWPLSSSKLDTDKDQHATKPSRTHSAWCVRQHCSRSPRSSRSEPIRSRRKKPPLTTQQQLMLWPDPLLLIGRASMIPGQRIRFATSAVSSLLSTSYQQMNSQRANLVLDPNLVFTVQEMTVVTLMMLLPPISSRQWAGSRPRPHTREGGGSWQTEGQRKDQHKGRRKSQ
jgi:hypothetical protein